MKTIASFTVDHLRLLPGVYVSRQDKIGSEIITTFDLRLTRPNCEPVMNTAEIHTLEHLSATFLRNHKEYGQKTIYFGPMGCRTGFYLLLAGEYTSGDIVPLLKEMFSFIASFDALSQGYPVLQGSYAQPKPVVLSRLMSYAQITGVFFPLTFEANINQ